MILLPATTFIVMQVLWRKSLWSQAIWKILNMELVFLPHTLVLKVSSVPCVRLCADQPLHLLSGTMPFTSVLFKPLCCAAAGARDDPLTHVAYNQYRQCTEANLCSCDLSWQSQCTHNIKRLCRKYSNNADSSWVALFLNNKICSFLISSLSEFDSNFRNEANCCCF